MTKIEVKQVKCQNSSAIYGISVEGLAGVGWSHLRLDYIGYHAGTGDVFNNQITKNRYAAGPIIKDGSTVAIIVDLINYKVRW